MTRTYDDVNADGTLGTYWVPIGMDIKSKVDEFYHTCDESHLKFNNRRITRNFALKLWLITSMKATNNLVRRKMIEMDGGDANADISEMEEVVTVLKLVVGNERYFLKGQVRSKAIVCMDKVINHNKKLLREQINNIDKKCYNSSESDKNELRNGVYVGLISKEFVNEWESEFIHEITILLATMFSKTHKEPYDEVYRELKNLPAAIDFADKVINWRD